jgi:Zn-dependent peptidase ImmA (M78 family)
MMSRGPRTASDEAADVLATVWSPRSDGLLRLPVDPAWIAGKMGIRVVEASLDVDVAGFLIKEIGRDAEIYLNASDSRQRRRFTCAHELGHYVRRAGSPDRGEWGYLDRRDSLSSRGTDPEEIWANGFAAALLMPEDLVRERFRGMPDPVLLAYAFGVSSDAMGNRLRTLRLT